MSTIHQIRGLQRGLAILEILNEGDGGTVAGIARRTALPRSTAYRVLENLCAGGYAWRDPGDSRYRVTIRVQKLSAGYRELAWIREAAQPAIHALARDILWPLYVATASGTSMVIRVTTTNASPLAVDHLSPGTRVPMLTSASGKCYLASCSELERDTLLGLIHAAGDQLPGGQRGVAGTRRELARTRRQGYAFDLRAAMRRNPGITSSFGVPVQAAGRTLGALVMRYTDAAMKPERVVERYLERLLGCARLIGARAASADDEARIET